MLQAARLGYTAHVHRFASTVVLMAALVVPAHALAQDDAAEARRHFDAGVRLFQAGDFGRALDEFRDAYRIRPHPSVLVNMANCYVEMGRPVEASEHFERYLRESGEVAPERRAEVERALGQARAALGQVRVEGPPGSMIFLDGASMGQTPLSRPAEVNPGPHIVELRHPDGSVQEERVEVERGGSVTVHSRPGEEAGTTHPTDTSRGLGAPGPGAAESGPAPASAPPPSEGGLRVPLLTWVAGGVAVGALAVGIAFGAAALSQEAEFDDVVAEIHALPPDHPDIADLQADGEAVADAQRANALAADLFFVGAAAAAGVAVYFLVTGQDDEPPAATVGVGPGSLVLRHRF